MRVLVCGDRNWTDEFAVGVMLGGLLEDATLSYEELTIIEGCARGADALACHFYDGPCEAPGGGSHGAHTRIGHAHYPADWKTHGKAAGVLRNQRMLEEGKPDVVLAFHDDLANSKGTGDMVRRAKKAGVPVYVVSHG